MASTAAPTQSRHSLSVITSKPHAVASIGRQINLASSLFSLPSNPFSSATRRTNPSRSSHAFSSINFFFRNLSFLIHVSFTLVGVIEIRVSLLQSRFSLLVCLCLLCDQNVLGVDASELCLS
ncbi:hypothetical protein SDJN02_00511, partial [Cucurbita argyrosperma subsp. argyrosperma]